MVGTGKKTQGFYLDLSELRESLPAYAAWFFGYAAVACGVVVGVLFKAFGETENGIPVGDIDAARGVAIAVLAVAGFLFLSTSLNFASDYGEMNERRKRVRK